MQLCNHYTNTDGKYKSLIAQKGERYICTQCATVFTKNDAHAMDRYCSLLNDASGAANSSGHESPLCDLLTNVSITEASYDIPAPAAYQPKETDLLIDENIDPFFYHTDGSWDASPKCNRKRKKC